MDEHQLFLDYLKELRKETPRGGVLISGVALEALLGKTLENFLTDHPDVKKLLSGGVAAPLGTLSARILMCFGLRLIDEGEYKNLTVIRKIRNHFAHSLKASFDDQKVVDLCKLLDASGMRQETVSTPQKKYNSVVVLMIVLMRNRVGMAMGRRIGEDGWQNRVIEHIRNVVYGESLGTAEEGQQARAVDAENLNPSLDKQKTSRRPPA